MISVYPRKQLDISWSDLIYGLKCAFFQKDSRSIARPQVDIFDNPNWTSCFCVRAGLDAILTSLNLPSGSEVLISGMTIPDIVEIIKHHRLIPVPYDLDLETLSPRMEDLEKKISNKTKAVIHAHLFGSISNLDKLTNFTKDKYLFLIEDCAQCFSGSHYLGNKDSDVVLFSFGPLKTSSSLGGAMMYVKNSSLFSKINSLISDYPSQTKSDFMLRIIKYSGIKVISFPFVYGCFVRVCSLLGLDYDEIIGSSTRNVKKEDLIKQIRRKPNSAMLALLARRLSNFDKTKIDERELVGKQAVESLPTEIKIPGRDNPSHSFWLFPIMVVDREKVIDSLRDFGIDANTGGSSMIAISSEKYPSPTNIKELSQKIVYLPIYSSMPHHKRIDILTKLTDNVLKYKYVTDSDRIQKGFIKLASSPTSLDDIRSALKEARNKNEKVSLMGLVNSQGGHTFTHGVRVLDMTRFNKINAVDKKNKTITVESGTSWDKIQKCVNELDLSVLSMQSSNQFSVGGSISANIHSRDIHASSIIDSIKSLRLMDADGRVKILNKEEDPELFSLVVGGYGLFGIILDAKLELTENFVYEQSAKVMNISAFLPYFKKYIYKKNNVALFMARFSIAPSSFFKEVVVSLWEPSRLQLTDRLRDLGNEKNIKRDRAFFELSRRYNLGKEIRWKVEKNIIYKPGKTTLVTRTNAMRPPITPLKLLENKSKKHTNTVRDVFIPINNFDSFIKELVPLLEKFKTNILGATIRYVKQNDLVFLSHAPKSDSFSIMLYLNIPFTTIGHKNLELFTKSYVDLAIKNSGTFYLTYPGFVTASQLKKAYPRIDGFFKKKREYDPSEMFTSMFYEKFKKDF